MLYTGLHSHLQNPVRASLMVQNSSFDTPRMYESSKKWWDKLSKWTALTNQRLDPPMEG